MEKNMTAKCKIRAFSLASALLIVLTACVIPFTDTKGSLSIKISDAISRSLLPGISMVPTHYTISGSGPNNASFQYDIDGDTSVTAERLDFGNWTVSVIGYNADNVMIGSGSKSVEVHTNETTSVTIIVAPLSGFGTLDLTLNWTAADIDLPQVMATLQVAGGEKRNLLFEVSPGSANFHASDIEAGYHTLILSLKDNGATVRSTAEIVRVASGQETLGEFVFSQVNKPGGTITSTIVPAMNDPLNIAISEAPATKYANEVIALNASCNNYLDSISYIWYVNGIEQCATSSFSFGSGFSPGYYSIDVVAYSSDYSRAGSASAFILVLPSVDATVPRDGLRAEYLFDGNADDSSGNENNGTINGATLVADRKGIEAKAFAFSGDDKIVVLNSPSLNFGAGDYTLCLWINRGAGTNYPGIINKFDEEANLGWGIGFDALNNRLGFTGIGRTEGFDRAYNCPAAFIYPYVSNTVESGWEFLTCVRDNANSSLRFYINGVLEGQESLDHYRMGIESTIYYCDMTTYSTDHLKPLNIGYSPNLYNFDTWFRGDIDDVRIYDRVLTQAEINALNDE